MDLSILYRGPLASCDYDCGYCPFAKRRDTPEQLRADRAALSRFTAWVDDDAQRADRISVLFTPWGEALTRSWYRQTMTELSHLPQIAKVAAQTNLSCRLDPLFPVSRFAHPALGRACRTGESVISVDGEGEVRRCHFVPRTEPGERLGNLYDGSFRAALRPRVCPLNQCDCHIGYVHMPELGLYDTFAGGVLERIPVRMALTGNLMTLEGK